MTTLAQTPVDESAKPINESIVDEWDVPGSFKIEEATGEVNGQHILAKVSGPSFFPGGRSRNKRWYPPELWEKVLGDPNVQRRLQNRMMFGSLGHTQPLDEKGILEGKATHIVSRMWMDSPKEGHSEYLILDTPGGRIMNTLLRAGCKFPVSSRADGGYKGKTNEGDDIVDPERYIFETFDFVIEPGFLKARPDLVESLQQLGVATSHDSIETQPVEGDQDMEKETKNPASATLTESLARDLGTTRSQLEEAQSKLESAQKENGSLTDKVGKLNEQVSRLDEATTARTAAETKLKAYEALGTAEDLKKVVEGLREFEDKVGTLPRATKALEAAHKRLREWNKDFGSPDKARRAMKTAQAVIESYKKLGTLGELSSVLENTKKNLSKRNEERNKARSTRLASELQVSEEKIAKLVARGLTDSDIQDVFKGVTESNELDKYRHRGGAKKTNEGGASKDTKQAKSLGENLMTSLAGRPAAKPVSEDPTQQ